jgi:hypothetical protein
MSPARIEFAAQRRVPSPANGPDRARATVVGHADAADLRSLGIR